MAHWAKVENGVVTQVTVGDNNDPTEGYQLLMDSFGGTWVKTSYNTRGGIHYGADGNPDGGQQIGYNYAGIGMLWDGVGFYTPNPPFASWILDKSTYLWTSPIPMPNDGKNYFWNEANKSWDPVE